LAFRVREHAGSLDWDWAAMEGALQIG
jgi:hypothetical protein